VKKILTQNRKERGGIGVTVGENAHRKHTPQAVEEW
jgi:hypothetical protein